MPEKITTPKFKDLTKIHYSKTKQYLIYKASSSNVRFSQNAPLVYCKRESLELSNKSVDSKNHSGWINLE